MMELNLMNILHLFIFPGFLFCFIFGIILSGIDRKVVARMQRRIGPPVLQPMYDFFKLMGKETIVPNRAARKAFLLAPIFGILCVIIIPLFIPVDYGNWLREYHRDWLLQTLDYDHMALKDFFQKDELRKVINSYLKGREKLYYFLTNIITLELWLRKINYTPIK